MKALAIDSAVSKLTISAKNDDKICTTIFDIGMKQSETILPAIEYVLTKVQLTASELDYMALTQGPGSFTGLRLAYSALKAIECAFKTPIYGISSLLMHSYVFFETELPVLSCIDANKDRFYANISTKNKEILPDGDYSTEDLISKLSELNESKIFITGPDRQKLAEILEASSISNKNFVYPKFNIITTEILFEIAEKNIENQVEPLKDFDGPVYLRASEAEIVLKNKEKNSQE